MVPVEVALVRLIKSPVNPGSTFRACGNNWGGSWQHKREAFRLPSCYVVIHKLPNRGPQIVGCLAKLALGKPSANYPNVRLGAAMSEAGAVAGCVVKEQPARSRKRYRDQ